MIAIQFSNVSLVLGARAIFRSLTWEIQDNQKIGLIGPNGAGKSSLLKLITGEYTAEPGGGVTRARGVSIGYLPQQPELPARPDGPGAGDGGQPAPGGTGSRDPAGGSQPGRPAGLRR